jgi:predicted metal-binding membrane protein
MARDMYGPMTGASSWMMTAVWDARHLALLCAMWAVMMVGMMLPSASPMLLLYGSTARRSATTRFTASLQTYTFAAGYLVVWAAFSLGATALQRLLAALLFVSSMMEVTSPVVGVGRGGVSADTAHASMPAGVPDLACRARASAVCC